MNIQKPTKKEIKNLFKAVFIVFIIAVIVATATNLAVVFSTKGKIFDDISDVTIEDADCIIVLGCGVYEDTPSPLLEDRINIAVDLYFEGKAPKILMSGDHGKSNYDEVNVMRNYAMERGVPSEDIFMDHAGFSTYETMYRAKEIFGVESAIVVTQRYHLYRSLYNANAMGMEVQGVCATGHGFSRSSLLTWNTREILARMKDFFFCIIKPKPTFLGEEIDIGGNGEATLG
ncbi:MAG: YdcF family protein [Clostridiales bacterium]|nr:YdcF family protein [Clostridiales bacterium]